MPDDSPHQPGERWEHIERIFHDAAELAGAEREAFLREACGVDGDLRSEVDELLSSHGVADCFLEVPEPAATVPEGELAAGSILGDYTIVGIIASGGMGTVYEAAQSHPDRRVALKVMRGGLLTASATRRFAYESEILGRLGHPCIAQVYAAGTSEDRGLQVPWFAMELVQGAQPITAFAERNRLATRERLELFADVCDAIHHGHLKGVLHRDIKPDNVLVDAGGRPKVIDFGVARTIDSELTTLRTSAGELVGTLGYMSPEQCSGKPEEIDPRSDVYALGALLYELLTGERPYELTGHGITEAIRVIRDRAPKRFPEHGLVGPGSDAEAIAFKALEKPPQLRYQSVAALADDVRRLLGDEPIEARTPSFRYHMRLFARRHRALIASCAAILVVLIGASVVSTLFAVEASARAHEAETARDDMDVERNAAVEMLDFFEGILRKANPIYGKKDLTVRELLAQAEERLQREFAERPRVRIRLLHAIADSYRGIGRQADARRVSEGALAQLRDIPGDTRFWRAAHLTVLGLALTLEREFEEAEKKLREAVALRRELTGRDLGLARTLAKLGSLLTLSHRTDEAEQVLQESLGILRRSGAQDDELTAEIAERLANFGAAAYHAGDAARARKHFEKSLALFEQANRTDHLFYAQVLANYGLTLTREPEAAMTAFRRAIRILTERTGERSEAVASTREKLAFLQIELGQKREAGAELGKALAIRRAVHGADSVRAANTMVSLAYFHMRNDDLERAKPLLLDAFAIQEHKLAKNDVKLASTLVLLGRIELRQGHPTEAEKLLTRAVKIRRKLGRNHPRFAAALSALAACRSVLGHHAKAEPLLLSAHAILEKDPGPENGETLAARRRLAEHFERCGKPEEAAKWRD